MKRLLATVLFLTAITISSARAQQYYPRDYISANTGITMEMPDLMGLNLGMQWTRQKNHLLTKISFMELNFVPAPAYDYSRYHKVDIGYDHWICRDSETGGITDDRNCSGVNWNAYYAISADLHYIIKPENEKNLAFGVGGRLGHVTTWYISSIITLKNFSEQRHPYFGLKVGPRFFQVTIGFSWMTQ